jgi:hypothetical protein
MLLAMLVLFAAPGAFGAEPAKVFDTSALMRRQVLSSVVMKCSVMFPKMKDQLASQFADWRTDRAAQLEWADQAFSSLPTRESSNYARIFAETAESIAKSVDVAAENHEAEAYCSDAVSVWGGSKDSTYYDADNFGEAIAMYAMDIVSAETQTSLCVAQFPAIAPEIELAKAEWRERDATVQRRARAWIETARKAEPAAFASMQQSVTTALESAFAAVQSNPGVAERYCHKQFSDRASGATRLQTPKVYYFLEHDRDSTSQPKSD